MQGGDGGTLHAGSRGDPALRYLYKEEFLKGSRGQATGGSTVLTERSEESLGHHGEGISGMADLGRIENGAGPSERWNTALANITEIGSSMNSLQRLLLGKAVYVDEEAFAQASANAHQTRTSRAQERRIRALERELDAAVVAAGHARAEKKQAEIAQRTAEARTQDVLRELENTTQVFKLHMEELRMKQGDVQKKDAEIQVLQAIIEALRSQGSQSKKNILKHQSTPG